MFSIIFNWAVTMSVSNIVPGVSVWTVSDIKSLSVVDRELFGSSIDRLGSLSGVVSFTDEHFCVYLLFLLYILSSPRS